MRSYSMNSTTKGLELVLKEVDQPKPGGKQVLVKVKAAGLNRGEFIAGHGLIQVGKSVMLGMEAAGEVVALGQEMTHIPIGEAVFGRMRGAFSEYALLDDVELMPKPALLSWEQAAGIPLSCMVVFDMLVLQGRLKPNEWVLVNGVSSGAGVAALQMAKALGAKVIGTSGSEQKLTVLNSLGLDHGICARQADYYDEVMAITNGYGIDLVINTVGGSVFAQAIQCLALHGRYAMVGYVDGQLEAKIDLKALHTKRLSIFGVSNKLLSPAERAKPLDQFRQDILPILHAGRLTPWVDRVFDFDKLPQAREYMQSNQHIGKVIIRV